MRYNPIQFQEPTFGDNFHREGASGYSVHSDGRKSPHMAGFNKRGVTQALATFLVLEGAGNLRKATLVPTSQDTTITVDLNGRRFFAGVTPYDDIWIKEMLAADGNYPYTQEIVLWSKWAPEGRYPATNWFRSVPLKRNPVWIRPEGSAQAQLMERAYDTAYDNPGAQKLEAFSPGEKVEVQFPTQRGPHLWHEGRVVMVQFGDRYVVAIDSGKGDGEQQYSVPGLHMRRKVSAESEAREAAKRLKAELKALLQARNNPGRAQYVMFAQAAKAKGKTPAQIKAAYAKKKGAEAAKEREKGPKAIRAATIEAEAEIFDLMGRVAGREAALNASGSYYTFDYDKGKMDFDLPSPSWSTSKVGDPEIIKGIKAVAKKYAPRYVKITVAVSNPRY